MKLKNRRHEKILEIIKELPVNKQESLTAYLSEAGFKVTQATVSRDIRELQLVKVLTDDGYRYEQRDSDAAESGFGTKAYNLIKDNAINVRSAQNIVVIKCYPGMADAVCASIDSSDKSCIVGSIAGDDTVFLATEDNDASEKVCEEINRIIH